MAPFWKLMEMLLDGATRAHKPPLLETLAYKELTMHPGEEVWR